MHERFLSMQEADRETELTLQGISIVELQTSQICCFKVLQLAICCTQAASFFGGEEGSEES